MAKKKENYAFIDSQNLNLGVRSMGWTIDYRKFRSYLRNKYNITKAFMFIGWVASNQALYTELQSAGFILIFKQTVGYTENGTKTVKGNVDAELVLHAAAIEYNNYSQAIIITGDGDFACLADYLKNNDKLLKIIAPTNKYSKLLKPFSDKIINVGKIRNSIEYQKSQHRRSVETLGLSGDGDIRSIPKKTKKVNSKGRR